MRTQEVIAARAGTCKTPSRLAAFAATGLLAMASTLLPRAAGAATLQEIDYITLPGNRVQINFEFDEAVPAPNSFKTADPARVALDFMGVSSALESNNVDIGIGAVDSVTTAEAGGQAGRQAAGRR